MKIMVAMTKSQPPQHHVKHQGMVFVLEIVQQAQITIVVKTKDIAGQVMDATIVKNLIFQKILFPLIKIKQIKYSTIILIRCV